MGLDMPVARESRRAHARAGRQRAGAGRPLVGAEESAKGRASGAARAVGAPRRSLGDGELVGAGLRRHALALQSAHLRRRRRRSASGRRGARLTLPWTRSTSTNRVQRRRRRAVAQRRAKELGELQRRRPRRPRPVRRSRVEKGALSLDQRELVSSVGPYVRDELELGRFRATRRCARRPGALRAARSLSRRRTRRLRRCARCTP